MAMKRLATLAGLTLPIGDKDYVIPPVDADTGLYLTELTSLMTAANAAAEQGQEVVVDDEQAQRLRDMSANMQNITRVLSDDVYQQMRADGVPWPMIQLAVATVMIWTVAGPEAAEKHWNRGGAPAPKAPMDRKKPAKKATPRKK